MEAAAAIREIHNVLQLCGISKLVACTCLINNKGFNYVKDFGVMDGDTDMLEMENILASRAVTNHVNLRTVQIKGLQVLVWWIQDRHTHNQPLIADEFGQSAKRVVMTGERI